MGPLTQSTVKGIDGGLGVTGDLEPESGVQIPVFLGALGHLARRQNQQPPIIGTFPGMGKGFQTDPAPGSGSGMEDNHVLVQIIADHHGVMPAGEPFQPQILQNDHRASGGDFP